VRHGTTSLFGAFDISSGSVIAYHYRRHRHQELPRFLKLIDTAVPHDLDLRLILDSYANHKTPMVTDWLIRHPLPPALRPDQLIPFSWSARRCGGGWSGGVSPGPNRRPDPRPR
jgi:hypothetical protein